MICILVEKAVNRMTSQLALITLCLQTISAVGKNTITIYMALRKEKLIVQSCASFLSLHHSFLLTFFPVSVK